MGVSKNRRGPRKWMVKIMGKPYFSMDDLGGRPTPIFGLTPMCFCLRRDCDQCSVIFALTFKGYE